MTPNVFSEVVSIEAEAAEIGAEAEATAKALAAEAAAEVERLQAQADADHDQRLREAREHSEADLDEKRSNAQQAHARTIQRLDDIRNRQIGSLADWLIERLLDGDREH